MLAREGWGEAGTQGLEVVWTEPSAVEGVDIGLLEVGQEKSQVEEGIEGGALLVGGAGGLR